MPDPRPKEGRRVNAFMEYLRRSREQSSLLFCVFCRRPVIRHSRPCHNLFTSVAAARLGPSPPATSGLHCFTSRSQTAPACRAFRDPNPEYSIVLSWFSRSQARTLPRLAIADSMRKGIKLGTAELSCAFSQYHLFCTGTAVPALTSASIAAAWASLMPSESRNRRARSAFSGRGLVWALSARGYSKYIAASAAAASTPFVSLRRNSLEIEETAKRAVTNAEYSGPCPCSLAALKTPCVPPRKASYIA